MLSRLNAIALLLALSYAPAAAAPSDIDLSACRIVPSPRAHPFETLAARELQRYLRLIGHRSPTITPGAREGSGVTLLVGTPNDHPAIARLVRSGALRVDATAVGDEGFVLRALPPATVVVSAATPRGVLWGAYALLEQLGVGFYLGGDALAGAGQPRVPASLSVVRRPAFKVRGSLPWYNFLNSPTTWDRDDYHYFFDQMAKMRCNFVGFHSYDSEPFCAFESGGKLVGGEPVVTAHNYGWGTVRGMSTAEFGFGTGDFFFGPEFGSAAVTATRSRDTSIRRSQALLADGLRYARSRGLKVCVGFEVSGDPTDAASQEHVAKRLEGLLRAYPMLDYVWVWQSEGLGGGTDVAPPGSQLSLMAERYAAPFAYLRDPRRAHEAVRVMLYARMAHDVLRRIAPRVRMVVSGWGGDQWMHFSDFYEGLDRTLPSDVIFAALDNIDPTSASRVAAVYGKLSKGRERWPIPWWESDGGYTRRDQWGPQCNAAPFLPLCRDALSKGCQGMLAIHWRTRDVEEAAALEAQFAWDTGLTYERFFEGFARRCYGARWAAEMGAVHRALEALGPRYTGTSGQVECGGFEWFSDGKLPSEDSLRKLAALRARIATVRVDMVRAGRTLGLERIDWLLTTIDWLTRYDAAALALRPHGEVDKLLDEAEAARGAGQTDRARSLAQQAATGLRECGLAEALRTYPWKMTTCGEWGTLATINVKAYAAYQRIAERIRAAGGDPGPEPKTLAEVRVPGGVIDLRVVMRTPPSLAVPGRPLEVSAIVIGDRPTVRLHYRRAGQSVWSIVPMRRSYRSAWKGLIPAASVTDSGIEYMVVARDAAGNCAMAPRAGVWSAAAHPVAPEPPFRMPAVTTAVAAAALHAECSPDYEVRLSWPAAPGADGYLLKRWTGAATDLTVRTRLTEYCDAAVTAGATHRYTVAALDAAGKPGAEAGAEVAVPRLAPPAAPQEVVVRPGAGKIRISWKSAAGRARGYEILRSDAPDREGEPLSRHPVADTVYLDLRADPAVEYTYRVRAVDRGGQSGALSAPVSARALSRAAGPVFVAPMDGTADASGVHPEMRGAVAYPDGVVGQALDTRTNGCAIYPHQPAFELDGEFGVMFWCRPRVLEGIPVLASCGEFMKQGWFVQIIGGRIRFSLGGANILDAGGIAAGAWCHVACTYDGAVMRVYLNGAEVGQRAAPDVDFRPWPGPLFVGQYHFLEGQYQYRGLIDDLRLFAAAPTAAEVEQAWKTGAAAAK